MHFSKMRRRFYSKGASKSLRRDLEVRHKYKFARSSARYRNRSKVLYG